MCSASFPSERESSVKADPSVLGFKVSLSVFGYKFSAVSIYKLFSFVTVKSTVFPRIFRPFSVIFL